MKRQTAREQASVPISAELRADIVRLASEAIGARWMLDYSATFEQSGRRIEGGWPGTLPEARGRVLASLPQELSARGAAPLSPEELVIASAIASAQAKRSWQIATKRLRRKASALP